ncbi:MAG: hypothetical protein ACJATI_005565, partial [Halioglobus sp.]
MLLHTHNTLMSPTNSKYYRVHFKMTQEMFKLQYQQNNS